jgi:hypothetical protein
MYFKSMEREKFAAAHSTAIKALEMCFWIYKTGLISKL